MALACYLLLTFDCYPSVAGSTLQGHLESHSPLGLSCLQSFKDEKPMFSDRDGIAHQSCGTKCSASHTERELTALGFAGRRGIDQRQSETLHFRGTSCRRPLR